MGAVVVGVSVANPGTMRIKERDVPTGFFKRPAEGPVEITREGLRGDTIVEARRGGLLDQALCVYPEEHYSYWREEGVEVPDRCGAFGENLTVAGVLESGVRVGEIWRLGSALVQVSQPRLPCRKLDHQFGRGFARRFLRSRRVGYYLRVLEPGQVGAGDAVEVVERPPRAPSMDVFVRVSQFDYWDVGGLRMLLASPNLSEAWIEALSDKLKRSQEAIGWHGSRPLRVRSSAIEAREILSYDLECPFGYPLPAYRGGQYLTMSIATGDGNRFVRQPVTLSGDPRGGATYRVTVRNRRVRGTGGSISSSLEREISPGQEIQAMAPRGEFVLPEASLSLPVAFITEGIGLAPVVGMLRERLAVAERETHLLHCDINRLFHPFRAEIAAIKSPRFLRQIYYRSQTELAPGDESHRLGWPGASDIFDWVDVAAGALFFLSGSDTYVQYLRSELTRQGLPDAQIFEQSFGTGETSIEEPDSEPPVEG
jgi:MOSC domain-containing protein YiiM/ferredoxin-NADP reductase